MHILLLSTYELGRQPFGLASPAAWLRRAGATVTCCDTAVQALDEAAVQAAAMIGLYVPMHTATRLTLDLLPRLRALNPAALLVAYGLYAPMNAELLRECGVQYVIGGEFEAALSDLATALMQGAPLPTPPPVNLARLPLIAPDRHGLPGLNAYAGLMFDGVQRVVGYTEATRGCKHTCRHCPVVPVYNGRFRAVPLATVLADVRQQVERGAQHITFGDPDFLNGPTHALRVVEALHREFPNLTYDATIKVEHLLQQRDLLPRLRAAGCVLITSAVEAFNDAILDRFAKHHTRADIAAAVELLRQQQIALNATFVAFTPWTTRAVYQDFLRTIRDLDLVESVAPVQYAIRLLIPSGSRLLDLAETHSLIGAFDPRALCYPWQHPDPTMDELQRQIQRIAQPSAARGETRAAFFARVWALAHGTALPAAEHRIPRPPIPFLTEPWYC